MITGGGTQGFINGAQSGAMSRLFNFEGGDNRLETAIDEVYADHELANHNDCADFVVDVAHELGISQFSGLDHSNSANDVLAKAQAVGRELSLSDPDQIKNIVAGGGFVIAAQTGNPHGHVVILRSGDWGTTKKWFGIAPPIAHRSMSSRVPASRYTTLNYGFGNPSNVKIFHIGGKNAFQSVRELDYFGK